MNCIAGLVMLAGVWAVQTDSAKAFADTPVDHLELLALLDQGEAALATADPSALRQAADRWDRLGVRNFDGGPSLIGEAWRAAASTGDETPPVRGAVQGPGVRRGALESGAQVRLTRAFYAGRVARITLGAPHEAALELRIQESEGPAVCEQVAHNGPVTCEWTPIWTSDYLIEVRNLADGPARYRLVSN